MIFISHKLHEVKAVADRVTVLRGGRVDRTVSIDDATPRSLAALMVGRELAEGAEPGPSARSGGGDSSRRRALRRRRPRPGRLRTSR